MYIVHEIRISNFTIIREQKQVSNTNFFLVEKMNELLVFGWIGKTGQVMLGN